MSCRFTTDEIEERIEEIDSEMDNLREQMRDEPVPQAADAKFDALADERKRLTGLKAIKEAADA